MTQCASRSGTVGQSTFSRSSSSISLSPRFWLHRLMHAGQWQLPCLRSTDWQSRVVEQLLHIHAPDELATAAVPAHLHGSLPEGNRHARNEDLLVFDHRRNIERPDRRP